MLQQSYHLCLLIYIQFVFSKKIQTILPDFCFSKNMEIRFGTVHDFCYWKAHNVWFSKEVIIAKHQKMLLK